MRSAAAARPRLLLLLCCCCAATCAGAALCLWMGELYRQHEHRDGTLRINIISGRVAK